MPVNLLQHAALGVMNIAPRSVIWRFSQRYIAGTTLADAFETAAALNANGCTATVDVLGEDSTDAGQVQAALQLYLQALDGIHSRGLECGVSVKLSEMGLRFDREGCKRVMHTLLTRAAGQGTFVRIDMEDSSVTSITLELYQHLRNEFDNVGAVIQSCLRRSSDDIAELLQGGVTDVRLCKGIYIEPETIAYRQPDEIREAFKSQLVQLFEASATRVGIATHDPALVAHATDTINALSIEKDRYEFQMLLGVAEPMRRRLISDGHPVRVYVPFGQLWFAYSMRRLRENPNIARHIASNLFRPR